MMVCRHTAYFLKTYSHGCWESDDSSARAACALTTDSSLQRLQYRMCVDFQPKQFFTSECQLDVPSNSLLTLPGRESVWCTTGKGLWFTRLPCSACQLCSSNVHTRNLRIHTVPSSGLPVCLEWLSEGRNMLVHSVVC